ncbi:hypothetical protein L596_000615 [Steinernema carpocapsae]|uniref:Integrase catalytic domain-containing protein n=1 Tax=Steinernema carpocapsae TaxID=34508 RepID=A0A4U8UIY9_STECR|nr:hypothetical protein L596_000615 [Steinernema carpocapsae]
MVGEPKNRRVTSRLPKLSDNPEGGPQKVYGVIFTCTVTRMVHLELVGDMTTINFLRALRRFISEKDKPDDITCDNGPQMLLAEVILKMHIEACLEDQEVLNFTAQNGIRWIQQTR